ncbi:MAG TPA: hypothetical protein VMV18_01500 [bacterium]|nr:hypothetical protein [bacterium]
MRLIAYDFEALVRIAQQAPLEEGMREVRPWLADVRARALPEGGFGRGDGAARRFDAALLDATAARLEKARAELGGTKALREMLGDTPDRPVAGVDGWTLYEDLVRVWTGIVSAPWTERDLAGDGLLRRISDAVGRDLRLARDSALCLDIGMPYPATWRGKPRARIYHVSTEYLAALWEVGNAEADAAAKSLGRDVAEVRAQLGELLRHFERARTLDTVVAVDPDDAAWA